jgi:DNA/RNA endonuclease YhcR with UshA esterase domain
MRSAIAGIAFALAAQASISQAANSLTAQQAAEHVGETATVCGIVVSANYATKSKGQPTFLNFDQPYPNQIFTVMIWGSDRPKFGTPEQSFKGKRVCATGAIMQYRGQPEIIATDPQQLTVK